MANRSIKHLLHNIDASRQLLQRGELYGRIAYAVLNRFRSESSKAATKDALETSKMPELVRRRALDSSPGKYSSDDDDLSENKRKSELSWLTKALEPALQFWRWALPTGIGPENRSPPSNRSIAEIISSIQRSKVGIQDWTLSDLTIGLYLVYLRQASANPLEDVKGVQISSESVVQELMYHTELAKGCYKDNAAGLAKHSMLRESNVIKFVKNSSFMRPGYYIGIDYRKKLVILGIRGTHTVYDLITDIVSSSDGDFTFEGYSTHFGTFEAARWFLEHEMGTIKKCLDEHKGFRLRLVGHSLGGATASLLAVMLRKKLAKELGFNPNVVSAIGYGTPPCVSKELAESCSDYVATVVMQDDIIPRLSVASLARLRNEILQTDWLSVLEKEDWKNIVDLVTNAKQVVSSVQDVARKVADYAKFKGKPDVSDFPMRKESISGPNAPLSARSLAIAKDESRTNEELFVPGTVYYIKRNRDDGNTSKREKAEEYFTLWKRQPGDHFQRILLSSNLISAHKCDSHLYALRDVLKGLPGGTEESIFR